MTLRPNARARAVADSVTLAISAKAAELRRAGKDVVSLGAGEPDFPTPEPVAEAGVRAIQRGDTRYTPAMGTNELREAACTWFERTFGLRYALPEVMVTAGAKPALHMALMSVLEPGDRVLLPAPYWVSYPDLIRVADGEPVVLPPAPEQGFVPTGAQIAAAAREHGARGLILNFPGNPSGAVPSRQQMQEIVDAARAHDLWILSDEIYGTLIYEGDHVSPAALARERTMVVNGGSKSHTLTGWRVGFLAGPEEVIAAAGRVQSQVIGNPSAISQAAAVSACLTDLSAELQRRRTAYDQRRRFLVERINRIPGLHLRPPQGAFYALVDARELLARLRIDDVALCQRLLDEVYLATVPGTAFAIPGFVRLSFATGMRELERAVERLERFVRG